MVTLDESMYRWYVPGLDLTNKISFFRLFLMVSRAWFCSFFQLRDILGFWLQNNTCEVKSWMPCVLDLSREISMLLMHCLYYNSFVCLYCDLIQLGLRFTVNSLSRIDRM
eukprot:TRINITY_DN9496_c0_g2_i3.p2 TRINITY_DN9496_c0_g2~~TRINITY_DN9496_c0_g2_i3.p2  ORF type:complete len:110 (+),score=13.19 TRINITY_DN9496_c0_g2_i3:1202-1531(+)